MSKLDKIIEDLSSLTILEASELTTLLEDKWGVSAAAPVAIAAAPAADSAVAEAEKDEFSVVLADVGPKKIEVIKIVRTITGLGLKEAKELVEGAPKEIKADVPKEEANKIKEDIEKTGAKVELK